jgi:membrane-associated phospholipid phosphatase
LTRIPRGAAIAAGLAFLLFTLAAFLVGTDGLDTTVRQALLDLASPAVLAVMRVINLAGYWKFFVLFDHARRMWWVWIALMCVAPMAEGLLKIGVGRARPESPSFGFPSGHATAAAAYFGAWIYLVGVWPRTVRAPVRVAAVVMMLAVGLARIMLRAHWPSDVLGGLALGLMLASLAALIASRSAPERPRCGRRRSVQ